MMNQVKPDSTDLDEIFITRDSKKMYLSIKFFGSELTLPINQNVYPNFADI